MNQGNLPSGHNFFDSSTLSGEQPTVPKRVYDKDFLDLAETLKNLSPEFITNLSDSAIFELADPIVRAAGQSPVIPKQRLLRTEPLMRRLTEEAGSMSREQHQAVSRQVDLVLATERNFYAQPRILTADQLRNMLLNLNSEGADHQSTCSKLFNTYGTNVILTPGAPLSVASLICPEGTSFLLLPGIYPEETVQYHKPRTNWVGIGRVRLTGNYVAETAFTGHLQKQLFAFFDVENYTHYGFQDAVPGIEQGSESVLIRHLTFRNIGAHKNGQTYGAIKFSRSKDVEISNNIFNDVTSSIRFINAEGPIQVSNNSALNTGRNFFQCDKCFGAGIEITGNTLEHISPFGTDLLEDFINIFASEGTADSPIRVYFNRARTNGKGLSKSGSFIILGDFGGEHQEAKHNLGINPGQVGIGAASGHFITVKYNRMYSDELPGISNTAYYSWRTPAHAPDCSNHHFEGNRANWTCGRNDTCRVGELNRSWSPGSCGLSNEQIREHTVDDILISPSMWID